MVHSADGKTKTLRRRFANRLKADEEQSKTPSTEILLSVLMVKPNGARNLLALGLSCHTALGGAMGVSRRSPHDHCYRGLHHNTPCQVGAHLQCPTHGLPTNPLGASCSWVKGQKATEARHTLPSPGMWPSPPPRSRGNSTRSPLLSLAEDPASRVSPTPAHAPEQPDRASRTSGGVQRPHCPGCSLSPEETPVTQELHCELCSSPSNFTAIE